MAKKFDVAFAYLVQNLSTPAFGLNRQIYKVSATDKVRIKSLASATRVAAIDTASKSGFLPQLVDSMDEDETDQEDGSTTGAENEIELSHDQVAIGLSRLYRQTMDLLGDDLG